MHRITDEELLEELKKRFSENKKSLEELTTLNNELLQVNKKLEESEALKSHFISNITNEIINPFTSILGLAKNILEVKKEDWKRVISMVALIHTEAFNLDFQLRNIFVAAKLEAGEIAPEITNIDLQNLVKNVVHSFRIEANKKQIRFETDFDESIISSKHIKTDAEKLKLILSNLLSNAVKFSYEDDRIDIKCSKKDNNIIIIVEDYGVGISETNQKIIFDRFKRIDSGINSVNRGHGLGLSINKALIDLLNGKIEINSQIGKGARFTVIIPEAESDPDGFASDGNEFIFDADDVF